MTTRRDALIDEIELRRASISDAREELAAGEMTSSQFGDLEEREIGAISRCEAELVDLDNAVASASTQTAEPATSSKTSKKRAGARRHRRAYLLTALACFALAVIIFLVAVISPRQPGNSDTGSISGSTAQRVTRLLTQGEVDLAVGSTSAALAAFNSVLTLQPHNVEALAQSGWLIFSAGSAERSLAIIRQGGNRVALAVALAPRAAGPRLYYSIIAASVPGNRAIAVREFRVFLTLHPNPRLLVAAKPWLRRFGLSTN